jgi:VIT1/CCC1 family predicted Fe2+/Mn2+ transporter
MSPTPTNSDIRRWRKYLAAERAEAAVYRDLAARRTGEEKEILLALAEAEGRHEKYWLHLLGDRAGPPREHRSTVLGFLARRFGSVFVLALAQRAEARSPYESDIDAPAAMIADEHIHEEVVRALAARGRQRLSGTFRAAVFGANDGLVSNLALVLGISAAAVPNHVVLLTGVAGLLAGALSMGAGEFVSVRSQRELLDATTPNSKGQDSVPDLDVNANELALVYRARGLSPADAKAHADEIISGRERMPQATNTHETVGSALGAAVSSFLFFASGAIVPVLPYLFGAQGLTAVIIAAALVGSALLGTGSIVGLLSGTSPVTRALRQLAIGFGAAGATYLLGLLFGVSTA